MKKFRTKVLIIWLVIAMLSSLVVVNAQDKNQSNMDRPSVQAAIAEDGYNYPVKSGTEEWNRLTDRAEKLKITRLPNEELAKRSTIALIETILNYTSAKKLPWDKILLSVRSH